MRAQSKMKDCWFGSSARSERRSEPYAGASNLSWYPYRYFIGATALLLYHGTEDELVLGSAEISPYLFCHSCLDLSSGGIG